MTGTLTQLVRLKWLLGQGLAFLSLWTISALDLARGPILVATVIITIAVTVFPRLPAKVPLGVRRFVAPALILVFLGDLILNGRDVIPPMVRLLLILLAIRIITFRKNREDLQLVLLTMFLSVVSGVFTLSILFAVQAFFFAMLSIGVLFVVNLLESMGEPMEADADWDHFSWRDFGEYLRETVTFRAFRSLVLLLVLLLATTGLLFVSIPRVYLDQAIPFLKLPTAGMSGFSDVVRLGDVTSIQEDDSVALWVDVPSLEAVPVDPYWRMLVLDRYAEGAFINSLFFSPDGSRTISHVHSISPYSQSWFAEPNPSKGQWTFYLEEGVSRYLPMLGPFRELKFQGRQPLRANSELLVFRIPESTSSVFSYQVNDFLVSPTIPKSALDEPLLTHEQPENEMVEKQYPFTTVEVPVTPEEQEFLQALLAEIVGDSSGGPEQVALRIMAYLQSTHRYSLSPGGMGYGDPVVQWLRDRRAGHCEFFAGAFTLLARTAGIPTRMAVGFHGGSWNSFEDYFVVRNRNAHAWCEIFDGEKWVRFDPTPGGSGGSNIASTTADRRTFEQESDFDAWVDSLRVMWFRRVINFDDSSQEDMVENFANVFRDASRFVREFFVALWEVFLEWCIALVNFLRESVLAVLLLVAVVISAPFLYRRSGLLWLSINRPGIVDPLRRRAGKELQRLNELTVENHDRERKRESLTARLLEIRFGPNPDPKTSLGLFREVQKFRREKH
ncbi:MAG: transglutaminaseTgpA domain-containing protein [Puniceicoccales bacterium]